MFDKEFLKSRPQLVRFFVWWKVNSIMVLTVIIMFLSFVTYFQIGRSDGDNGNTSYLNGYSQPTNLFWDENYHIASANRYIHGKYFMEPHPPLGKLIIALGEKIFNANKNLDTSLAIGDNNMDEIPYFKKLNGINDNDGKPNLKFKDGCRTIDKDGKIKEPQTPSEATSYCTIKDTDPINFNYSGVRFFPVLFAWMCCVLIFYLLYLITSNEWIAFVFSLGLVFDNALIVHSRGAMLESIQMFFILSGITYFVYLWKNQKYNWYNYLILGALIGLGFATKVNGLIITPLIIVLFVKDVITTQKQMKLPFEIKTIAFYVMNFVQKIGISAGIISLIFCSVFWVHFSIAKEFITEKNDKGEIVRKNNYPKFTSENSIKALENGKTNLPENYLSQLGDHLFFAKEFQSGVPKWDPTKGEKEAGSLPFTWPFGNRSIRYFVARGGSCKKPYPDDCKFSYLYLVPNITVWALSFVGVILALIKILATLLFGAPIQNKKQFALICLFAFLYSGYMFSIAGIDRVLYLYHYFIPMIFGLILASLMYNYFFLNKKTAYYLYIKYGILLVIGTLIFVNFVYFAPFSYRLDLTVKEFEQHNWIKYWGMMMDW